jgi:hypothetical protein
LIAQVSRVDALTLAELEERVRHAEPTAFLIPARVLRRVIKQDRKLGGMGLTVPHRKSYVIAAADLLDLADREDLGIDPTRAVPPTVLLLARPDPERLAETPSQKVLTKYWRLLFHARVHLELQRRLSAGLLSEADVGRRIERIGRLEFDEIRHVLRQEAFLLPPVDDTAVFVEFAAVYLELHFFAPTLLHWYFPAIEHFGPIDELLADDLNPSALFEATRPRGAADPAPEPEVHFDEPIPDDDDQVETPPTERPSDRRFRKLMRRADKAGSLGNHVKAAVLRMRASRLVDARRAAEARARVKQELDRLAARLRSALEIDDAEAARWSESLLPLVEPAGRGFWRREYRLLYDVQNVCVDHEREISTIDVVEWVLSGFRRPIRRRLPGQREVLMSKHLRTAARRLLAVRLSDQHRAPLAGLLRSAMHQAEMQLRRRFRPLIDEAIGSVGLAPRHLPERVARRKLVEELLDRIVDRGFLTMFDLRDAISRNNLKLPDLIEDRLYPDGGKLYFAGLNWPDLAVVREFMRGDRVLRADRRLSDLLDGVYRRGEVYLRWPQRMSFLAFGTASGRLIVRYIALPYGGAYVAVMGLHHLVAEGAHLISGARVSLFTPIGLWVLALGTLLLCILHVVAFRRACAAGVRRVFQLGKMLFYDLPVWLRRWPLMRRILDSRLFRRTKQFLVKPLFYTCLVLLAFPELAEGWDITLISGATVFVAVNVVLNSRLGRNAEELTTDWVVRAWARFRFRFLAAALQIVIDFFNRVVDTLDRLLYSVDEWLRFKAGQSPIAMVYKGTLGVAWFAVTYLVRFYVNLLIEPQINPVKHFPVVTVSHKIILPLSLTLTEILAAPLTPVLGTVVGTFVAATTVLLLPGMFGFLVWEFKENWRLFAANRPLLMKRSRIGSHGETMLQFMKPGFHSGRLPKLYARLRRADRAALATGKWKASLKHREALHHVEQSIRYFLERELIALLEESRRWGGLAVDVGHVALASNVVRIELRCDDVSPAPWRIDFQERSGWLVATVPHAGWVGELSDDRLTTLSAALVGVYKMAGVDLIREQLELGFKPGAWELRIRERELLVWPHSGAPVRLDRPYASYSLLAGPMLVPRLASSSAPVRPPVLDRSQILFGSVPVPWSLWVEVWQHDDARRTRRFADVTRLLPAALS